MKQTIINIIIMIFVIGLVAILLIMVNDNQRKHCIDTGGQIVENEYGRFEHCIYKGE